MAETDNTVPCTSIKAGKDLSIPIVHCYPPAGITIPYCRHLASPVQQEKHDGDCDSPSTNLMMSIDRAWDIKKVMRSRFLKPMPFRKDQRVTMYLSCLVVPSLISIYDFFDEVSKKGLHSRAPIPRGKVHSPYSLTQSGLHMRQASINGAL